MLDLKKALSLIEETEYTVIIEKIMPFLKITKKIIIEENDSLKRFFLNTLVDYFYDNNTIDGFKIIDYVQKYNDEKTTTSNKLELLDSVKFF